MGFFHDTVDAGLVHFMAYPECMKGDGPVLETVQTLLDDEFFRSIEVTHIRDERVRADVARAVAASGKRLGYGAQALILGEQLNVHSRHRVTRARSLARLKQAIEEAVQLGAEGFALMTYRDPGSEARVEETELLVDSLNQICEWAKAERTDLRVMLETFDRAPFGKNCLIGPTAEAVEVCRRVRQNFPGFGLLLDLSHLPLLQEQAADSLPLAGDMLIHAHVGNCVCRNAQDVYYGDNHPPFGYEEGENDRDVLVDFLEQLKQIGYLHEGKRSGVTVEIRPMGNLTSADIIANAKHTMQAAYECLGG